MSIRTNLRPVLVALAAAAALAGGTAAWATPLPPTQTQGAVSYVSGGVEAGEHAREVFVWPAAFLKMEG